MFDAIRAKVSGNSESEEPDEGDYEDEANAEWGTRSGIDTVPSGSDAAVTAVSSSSAQLLSGGEGRFGEEFCKVMYVTGWPSTPSPGMLDRLTAHSSAGVQVKLDVDPMDKDIAGREFKRRVTVKNKELYAKQRINAPDVSVVKDEKEELNTVLRSIENGSETIYWVGVYFVVRSSSKENVDKAADEIRRELANDDLEVTTADWVTAEGMTTTSPVGSLELPETTRSPMTASALGCLFPFSTSSMIEENGILYGYHGLNGSPVVVDRFNRRNGFNQLVIGNIGAGKSYGVKLLLLRRLVRDRDVSGVIVDPRGGFRELVETFGIDAEVVEVGGNVGINPLQIEETPQDVLDERPDMDPRGEKIESVLAFFVALHGESDDSSGLSATKRAVLSRAITTAYDNAGITKDPQTHSRDSPLPGDVDRVLGNYAKHAEKALGEGASEKEIEKWEDAAADLRMAMQPFREGGRYEHLNQPTSIGLGRDGKRIVLLDIQQSEASGSMPLTMKLLFDAIYERAKGPGRMIAAFDEAHHVMQNPGGLDWLERSVRYSRHFLLSLTLISQTADEFFAHPKAKTIADNCPIRWLFRTTGLTDEYGEKLGLSARESRFVREGAQPGDRERGYSTSLLSVDDLGTVPVRVEAITDREVNAIDPPQSAPTDGRTEAEGKQAATNGGRL